MPLDQTLYNQLVQSGVGYPTAVILAQGGGTYRISGTPGTAAGAQAGGSPPAPVLAAGSTDGRGSLTFGTGSAAAAGNMVVVTFATAFGTAPFPQVTPSNLLTASFSVFAVATTTTLTIGFGLTPTSSQANTVYAVSYQLNF